jgi:hypothetical protein
MSWLPTLMTTTPEEGYELAIKLSRVAVKKTQPNNDVREKLRPVYENDSDALISVSHVVAVNFQTISAANNYWRE